MQIAWGTPVIYYVAPPARRGGTYLHCECRRRFRDNSRYRRHWYKSHAQDALSAFFA